MSSALWKSTSQDFLAAERRKVSRQADADISAVAMMSV
jgi:hypothetical protein